MEILQNLAQQVERQRQLRVMEQSLYRQLREMNDKVSALKQDWMKEQADVERVEKTSLKALFYQLIGKKADKLEEEQRQAMAAAAKYHTASAELRSLQQQWEEARAELRQLTGCEARFEQAKTMRASELKAENSVLRDQIVTLEEKLGFLRAQKKELQEAVSAGNQALNTARQIQDELDSAENWGTWDMLGGGGLITQMAKHDHLDTSQQLVEHLQKQLRRFKTELADVEIYGELDLQIDEFLRFADWFFDGLFVDWMVQKRIVQAKEDVYRASWQIQSFLNRLENLKTDLCRREDQAVEELETILLSVR